MAWAERVADVFGGYDAGFGPLTVDVPDQSWVASAALARDELGCTFFDWLSAVDELAEGFSVVAHLANPGRGHVDSLLLRTRVGRDAPQLASLTGVFAGADWHQRETEEMFGITFRDGQPARHAARHLLLPEEFEGHPLRKDFVLASRVAKPWPGTKEPGESDLGSGAPSRRRMRPPGVPEPGQWGPREPGGDAPDPLAHAMPTHPARRRRRSDGEEPTDG